MKAAQQPYSGPNKRQKWRYKCAQCDGWFMGKEIQVDHVVPAGKLQDYSDLPGFVERLFCEADGLRILCDGCHQIKTNAEREAKKHTQNTHNET